MNAFHCSHSRVTAYTLVAAGLVAVSLPTGSYAAGCFNVPSTFRQCVGGGFGAGYHAQLSLEPTWKGTAASPGVRRTRPTTNLASNLASHRHNGFHVRQPDHIVYQGAACTNHCQPPTMPSPTLYHEAPVYAPAPIMAPGPALFAAPPISTTEPVEAPDDAGPASPSDLDFNAPTPTEPLPAP